MANATQQDGMIEQMQHLMTAISDLQTQVTNNNSRNNNNNSNNNGNSNGNSNGNGSNNGNSNGNGSGNSNGNNNNTRGRSNGYQGQNNEGYQGRNNGYQERGRGCGCSQGRGRTGTAAQLRKYYWTHGNCAHDGTECNYKDEGHIDSATYGNRQGGSNYLCNGAGS
jgi:hypothetical protein